MAASNRFFIQVLLEGIFRKSRSGNDQTPYDPEIHILLDAFVHLLTRGLLSSEDGDDRIPCP